MTRLTDTEQETNLNMTADDRDTWHVYSDDPVMIRKFESIGAVEVKTLYGGGKAYTLRTDQVLLRTGKKQMSERRKAQLATQLSKVSKPPVVPEEKHLNRAS